MTDEEFDGLLLVSFGKLTEMKCDRPRTKFVVRTIAALLNLLSKAMLRQWLRKPGQGKEVCRVVRLSPLA